MMEDLQNSSFAGNDDLLSDIPPAVVAGNEEHAAPPEEEPQPTAPPQEEPQPEKPRKTPPRYFRDEGQLLYGRFGAVVHSHCQFFLRHQMDLPPR